MLPALVRLLYSSDNGLHLTVKEAFVGVLKYHSQKPEVICMLLDTLRSIFLCVSRSLMLYSY